MDAVYLGPGRPAIALRCEPARAFRGAAQPFGSFGHIAACLIQFERTGSVGHGAAGFQMIPDILWQGTSPMRCREQAFGGNAFDIDDFVLIKEQLEIFDKATFGFHDSIIIDQLLGPDHQL